MRKIIKQFWGDAVKGYTLGEVSKDVVSRRRKAKKIIATAEQFIDFKSADVLDIGTGAGYIAKELSKLCKSVNSVDIVDDRKIKTGYQYRVVGNEQLPFKSSSFDCVVSNQVLEHITDQNKHLSEIRRVLKKKWHRVSCFAEQVVVN